MNELPLIDLLILIAFVALPIGDALATGFFLWLYSKSKRMAPAPGSTAEFQAPKRRRLTGWVGQLYRLLFSERSWLLLLLFFSNLIITLVFVFIGYLAYRRAMGEAPLEYGPQMTLVALYVLGLVPIIKMVAFIITRRRHKGAPPPFGMHD